MKLYERGQSFVLSPIWVLLSVLLTAGFLYVFMLDYLMLNTGETKAIDGRILHELTNATMWQIKGEFPSMQVNHTELKHVIYDLARLTQSFNTSEMRQWSMVNPHGQRALVSRPMAVG